MKNKYAAGRRLEWSVLDIFRGLPEHIYSTRTPGSKSKADIVAIIRDKATNLPMTILVQCKSGAAKISSIELDFLRALRDMGLGAIVAYKKKGNKKIELWSLEEAEENMSVSRPRPTWKRPEKKDTPPPFEEQT